MAEENQPAKPAAPQQPTGGGRPQGPGSFNGFLAEVIEVKQKVKTGIYGEIYTVSCRILEGRDSGRIIRRNLLGPIKAGDVIRLPDTSREARDIKVK